MQQTLYSIKTDSYIVSVQLPLRFSPGSEPEPDVSLVKGSLEDFDETVPSFAALVVEVGLSSLEFDRTQKLTIYARQQIPEYWILNLVDDCLEVFREPAGESYNRRFVLRHGDSIAPLAIPGATIAVSEMLPKRG